MCACVVRARMWSLVQVGLYFPSLQMVPRIGLVSELHVAPPPSPLHVLLCLFRGAVYFQERGTSNLHLLSVRVQGVFPKEYGVHSAFFLVL